MHAAYNTHVKRIVLLLVVVLVVFLVGKRMLTPDSFGDYGHYRGDSIEEEAGREIRHYTNASCRSCHEYEAELHAGGWHRTISCEFCHGPYADHIKDGKVIGSLPVKKGEEIKTLCLRCHNRAIQARPHDVIKTVAMPDHLKSKNVNEDHLCNQCHHVHAPLSYINRARAMIRTEEKK